MANKRILKSIVHGAGITFIAFICTYILAFFYSILIARSLGPNDYGTIMLAVAVLGFGRSVSLIGLPSGVQRYIGFYLGTKEPAKVKGIILSSLKLVMPFSVIVSAALFMSAEWISINIFHSFALVPVLRIFTLIIPLNALVELLKAIFLSFNNTIYTSVLGVIGEKFLTLIFSVIAIIIGSDLYGISIAYLAAYLLTVAMGFVLLEIKVYSIIRDKAAPEYRYNELLFFSMPLFLVGIFSLVLSWGDTFLLGYFMDEKIVGIYNVAFPLSYSLLMIPKSLDAIYYPISATLFAQKKIKNLSNTFNTIARWTFALMWPIFLVMIFFSQQIIFTLFGQEYMAGWKVLIITSIGIFIYSIAGPVETMLQTFNKTRFIFIMYSSIVIINILMNLYLIPVLGMEGAAISTSFLWSIVGIIERIKVRGLLQIRYELRYYAKYTISGMIALLAVFTLGKMIFDRSGIVSLTIGGMLFAALYLGLLILMGAFAKEDIMIMSAIESRLGLDLRFIKKIIKRFLG